MDTGEIESHFNYREAEALRACKVRREDKVLGLIVRTEPHPLLQKEQVARRFQLKVSWYDGSDPTYYSKEAFERRFSVNKGNLFA